jgi:carboxylate-amine ligase
VFERFPRTNIPDIYTSWSEFENYINLLIHTKCIDNAKKIWWDIRPHPYFPTLEFRVCDVPMRVEETIAIAALCQAVIAKLYRLHEKNQSYRHYSRALLMENKWRAARYGLDGKLIDFGKQTEVPLRSLMDELLEFVSDVAPELGSQDELAYINKIVAEGTGADRQLKVFAETGDLKAVVDYIIQQTEEGLSETPEKALANIG